MLLLSLGVLSASLVGTILRAILIIIIVTGVWFELQNPGLGFPSVVAAVAAVLYFASLYVNGLVAYWEIAIFVVGLVLLFLEIIVTPGFGILGVLGIICVVAGLTFSMVDNSISLEWGNMSLGDFDEALIIVVLSILAGVGICVWLTSKIGKGKSSFRKMALEATQKQEEGFIGVPISELHACVGKSGEAATILRPGGKVSVGGRIYDAVAMNGYVNEGESICVVRTEAGQLYVTKA